MNQNVINGNKKVRAATQEMLDILAEERAKKKSVKYTEAATNTEIDQGASSNKERPRRADVPKFNMDSILADKPQPAVPTVKQNRASGDLQGDLPEWAAQLFAMHAKQLPPSSAIGDLPPTALGQLGLSSSGFSTSDILNSGMSSPTIPKDLPNANSSAQKRALPWNREPNETCSITSTKKFAAALSKSPEMAVPTLGTSTTWNSDQFNTFYQFCQQLPGSIDGLLNSLSQNRGTPTGSQDALLAFQTDNQHFADSVLGLNSGQSAASWNGGTGASSGPTQELRFSQLLQMGLFGNVSAATTPSTSQSSSSPSGGPQANTADTDDDTEGF